jgi:tetratricopeptide (TPR) repeat protein
VIEKARVPTLRWSFLALLALSCAVGIARADEQDNAARIHFIAGTDLFHSEHYIEAIREFEVGYSSSGKTRPLFLANIGAAYRKLGRPAQARDYYRRFLEQAPPDKPPERVDRANAQRVLDELEAELKALEPPKPPGESATGNVAIGLPPPVPEKPPLSERLWPPGVGLIGSALLSLGASGLLFLFRGMARSDGDSAATLGARTDAYDRALTYENFGWVCLGAGGAALLVGIVSWAVHARHVARYGIRASAGGPLALELGF